MIGRGGGGGRIRRNATARLLLCGNSDADSLECDTRANFGSRFDHSLSFTFGRRDVADLADVDEEQGEEQEVPLHVELQMDKQ